MSDEKLSRIEKAGFTLKPDSPEIRPIYERVKTQFEARGIQVALA